MRQVTKAEWIGALRSGKYEQAQSALKVINQGFCCLGVLCDIAEVPISGQSATLDGVCSVYDFGNAPGVENGDRPYYYHSTVIPFGVELLSDLSLQKLFTVQDDEQEIQDHAISMNDSGSTFEEIADFLESVQ